jgi:hypothetical protein
MPSLRTLTLQSLLVLMEMLGGYTVLLGTGLLASSVGEGIFWPLLGAAGIGFVSATVMSVWSVQPPWDRLCVLLPGFVVASGLGILSGRVWTDMLLAGLIYGVAFWRGAVITSEPPVYAEAQGRFGYGFALIFFGIVWVIARGVIYRASFWHLLAIIGVVYLLTAMTALGLARVESRRERGATPAVILAVGTQLLIVAVAAFIGLAIFTHDIGGFLSTITRPFWDAISAVFQAVIYVLFVPLTWLIDALRQHAHPNHLTTPGPATNPHGDTHKRLHATPTHTIFTTILGLGVVLIAATGIALLIWMTIPRIQRFRPPSGFLEERRGTLSFAAMLRALRAWLAALFHHGAVLVAESAQTARRRVLGPEYPDDPVRRVYARLLYRASTFGVARAQDCTPFEFQNSLTASWPEGSRSFAAVTSAYVARRYSPAEPGVEEIAGVEEHWQRLRRIMRTPELEKPAETDVGVEQAAEAPRRLQNVLLSGGVLRMSAETVAAILAVVLVFALIVGAILLGLALSR